MPTRRAKPARENDSKRVQTVIRVALPAGTNGDGRGVDHGMLSELAQSSTLNPGTALKSLSPDTTVQLPRAKAIAAIWISILRHRPAGPFQEREHPAVLDGPAASSNGQSNRRDRPCRNRRRSPRASHFLPPRPTVRPKRGRRCQFGGPGTAPSPPARGCRFAHC